MSGHRDKQTDSNEVVYGTSPRAWGVADNYVPPKLGPLPDHVDLGEQIVGVEHSYLIATPFLMNAHSDGRMTTHLGPVPANVEQPSAFHDQLGLDPEPLFAQAFTLDSQAEGSISGAFPPPPLRIRFKPSRTGHCQAMVTMTVVGPDGSTDTKRIRVSGVGKPRVPEPPQPPQIVDDVHQPDGSRALAGTVKVGAPARPIIATGFDDAVAEAQGRAERLGEMQQEGANLAAREIDKYQRVKPEPELFDQLIEIAFTMGVSGIAGVVARFIAKSLGKALALPPQTNVTIHPADVPAPAPSTLDAAEQAPKQGGFYFRNNAPNPPASIEHVEPSDAQLTTAITDGAKEAIKSSAKAARASAKARKASNEGDDRSADTEGGSEWDGIHSTDPVENFITEYRRFLIDQKAAFNDSVRILKTQLAHVDPQKATAAMVVFGNGLDATATTAGDIHARAMGLQWITTVARRSLGEDQATLPDGSKTTTTQLDRARVYSDRGWFSAPGTPAHDGVLDIHVDLPVGSTPVETSGLHVRSAAITGVSQPLADRLINTNLRDAGIPMRFVVHGHPALITRDEIGRVRINGYLLTKDGIAGGREDGTGVKWTEAHMHQGAKFLVDKVLSKTLEAWGIKLSTNRIHTDDASQKDRK